MGTVPAGSSEPRTRANGGVASQQLHRALANCEARYREKVFAAQTSHHLPPVSRAKRELGLTSA